MVDVRVVPLASLLSLRGIPFLHSKQKIMRSRATYLGYLKNRRRHSGEAIRVALRHDGMIGEGLSVAVLSLALLVLLLIVLLIGG